MAAPVATENADETVRQSVKENGIRPFSKRTASTYSLNRGVCRHRRAAHSTAVAHTAPRTGVSRRRPGDSAAAASGSNPACCTKTHCSMRKTTRTPTQAIPLKSPNATAQPAAEIPSPSVRRVELIWLRVAVVMPPQLPGPQVNVAAHIPAHQLEHQRALPVLGAR